MLKNTSVEGQAYEFLKERTLSLTKDAKNKVQSLCTELTCCILISRSIISCIIGHHQQTIRMKIPETANIQICQEVSELICILSYAFCRFVLHLNFSDQVVCTLILFPVKIGGLVFLICDWIQTVKREAASQACCSRINDVIV